MRSFSNIIPNFAANLHLLVDSICHEILPPFYHFFVKNGGELQIFMYFCPRNPKGVQRHIAQ